MLIIRFARRGRRNRAMFDLVVAEKSRPVKKKFIEKLGHYDPHATAGEGRFVYNEDAIKARIAQGAQVSDSAAKKLRNAGMEGLEKFIEKRVQKPKKEVVKEEVEEVKEEPAAEETKAEEPKAEEAPKEEVKAEEPKKEEVKTEEPAKEEAPKENAE